MLLPPVRARLERNIAYHEAMADYHKEQAKKAEPQQPPAEQPVGESNGTVQSSDTVEGGGTDTVEGTGTDTVEGGTNGGVASAPATQPPPVLDEATIAAAKESAKIAELHEGVVKQLRDVLAGDPGPPRIIEQRANRAVTRRVNPPLRGGRPIIMN